MLAEDTRKGEIGSKLCGLERITNNSLMVTCGDGVMVAAGNNAVETDDVLATIGTVDVVDV